MSEHSVYEIIQQKVLEALDKGTVPWRKPWKTVPGNGPAFPVSMSTGKPYRGINIWLLELIGSSAGYTSQWWGTFDQIAEKSGLVKVADNTRRGYHWQSRDGQPHGVRQGEHGTLVVFWKTVRITETDVDTGERMQKPVPMLRYYKVFNAEQADGLPGKYTEITADATEGTFAEHREAEDIIKNYLDREGIHLGYDGGDRAYYTLAGDSIHIPALTSYVSEAEAYSTTFHELAHSTGHPSRLNREDLIKYGEHDGRPREEMTAEMADAMLMAVSGINDERAFTNSAAYISSWHRRISADPRLVVLAAARAQHAADWILGIKPEDHEKPAALQPGQSRNPRP